MIGGELYHIIIVFDTDVVPQGADADETADNSMDSLLQKYVELANEEDTHKLEEFINTHGELKDKESLGM